MKSIGIIGIRLGQSARVSFCQSKLRMASTAPITQRSSPVTAIEKPTVVLTNAVLRYQPGEERFEFSFKYHEKTFNFSRPLTETLQSFAERARANLCKKLKKFDPSSEIHCQLNNTQASASNSTDEIYFSNILDNDTLQNVDLSFRIGQDVVPVEVNPPEVFKIKFLKKIMVGFPLLPLTLEGSPCFSPESSNYKWEIANALDVEDSHKKRPRKKSESERKIWSDVPSSHNIGNLPVIIPDKSLVGRVLRLTCMPSDLNRARHGNPFWMETDVLVPPRVTHFLFLERLLRMEKKPVDNPNFIRVISYNILADNCATEEWFTGSPADSLPMDYRLPVLNSELKAYQGDIICLQEVDKKFFESHFKPYLSQECDLEGILCCKTGERTNREGVALFFNRNKFQLIQSNEIIISEFMTGLSFFQALSPEVKERIGDRSTVLQVCALKTKDPESILVISNTHLYFHPDADHIRLLQTLTCINYLEAKLEELKQLFPGFKITTLFCGDLNCTPPFGSLRLLTSGKVVESDEDWNSHPSEKIVPGLEVEHSLSLINSHPNNELTNIVAKFEGCIDYILYQEEGMKLLQAYPPPSKEEIAKICGSPPNVKEECIVSLPNFQAPSDHLPIIVDFELQKL